MASAGYDGPQLLSLDFIHTGTSWIDSPPTAVSCPSRHDFSRLVKNDGSLLAKTLQVSADELLGLAPPSEKGSAATLRLRKKLRKVETLPPNDQKTVLRIVDALLDQRGVA